MPRRHKHYYVNQIRRYRRKRNLRLRDVARLTGQPNPTNISLWENGYQLPSLKNALKLSAAIKCPLEVLFFDLFRKYARRMFNGPQK